MISCNYLNLTKFPSVPGSATKPAPGHKIEIFDESNNPVLGKNVGRICSKLPLPPSFMLGLWGNKEEFIRKYLAETKGYYVTGDAGYFDENGYLHVLILLKVMTRLDDVINTAGHRLSTA